MAEIVDVKRRDAHRAFKLLRDEREIELRGELVTDCRGQALEREAEEKVRRVTVALANYCAANEAFEAIALDTTGAGPKVLLDMSLGRPENPNG